MDTFPVTDAKEADSGGKARTLRHPEGKAGVVGSVFPATRIPSYPLLQSPRWGSRQ
jgi:hypothetical protein